MAFENNIPEWGNAGVEPSDELKADGFQGGYKPPSGIFNWFWHLVTKCINEIQTKFNGHEANTANPHKVTAAQVGLDKVENKPDSERSVNTANFASEAGAARKVNNALIVRFNGGRTEGTDSWTYDGATSRSINITPDKIGAAEETHEHTFNDIKETTDKKCSIVVAATSTVSDSGDSEIYAATVDGVTELYNGMKITIIPDSNNATLQPRLNINNLGDKAIRLALSFNCAATNAVKKDFMQAGRPIELKYDANCNLGIQGNGAWLFTDRLKTSAQDLYGTVPVSGGGTGATTKEEAQENLGIPKNVHDFNENGLVKIGAEDEYVEGTGSKGILIGYGASMNGSEGIAIGYHASMDGTRGMAVGAESNINSDSQDSFVVGTGCNVYGSANIGAGGYLITKGSAQAAFGKYNVECDGGTSHDDVSADKTLFMVGCGTSSARANAFRITNDGKCKGASAFSASGADFAEYFEWLDGNPDNEDRRGYFVTLSGNKIRKANAEDDYILGVVSATPTIAGNNHSEVWQGLYLTDVFGERLTEIVEVPETTDETGKVIPAHTETHFKINPEYDNTREYIGRDMRKEWSAVGMVGQLVVVDNGTCEVDGYCKVSDGGTAVKADEKTAYRVIERLDDTHIRILVK